MLSLKSWISLIFVLPLLNACFALTPYSFEYVVPGIDSAEVAKMVGNPYSKIILPDREILVYYVHPSALSLFITSHFPFIGFYPLTRTGTEYWVILQNNTVVTSGSVNELQRNLPEIVEPLPVEYLLNTIN